jgi:hypothetical protein
MGPTLIINFATGGWGGGWVILALQAMCEIFLFLFTAKHSLTVPPVASPIVIG